ncbi:hypothetical protein [Lentzea sp. NPDC003310]|uniref:thermonuclease family protein n=1 Tax=Lentzea sp. NPDC003310 TaxID=3154447 RepID=UPI0033A668BB
MPHPSEPAPQPTGPGIVRRLWWRADQRARFAVACLGVLSVLGVTGAVGFGGDERPVARDVPGVAVHRGDSFEVTVSTVSDVDSFEGVELDSGRVFGARVAGISPAPCWKSQSLAAAENLLRGKKVRLTVKADGDSGTDRLPVDVRLPDGGDYARAIVSDGVASADLAARGELAPVEMDAKRQRRGLWAGGCTGYNDYAVPTTTTTPEPTTTTPPPTTTTTTTPPPPPPPPPTTRPPAPPPPTLEPPDEDAEWLARFVGKRCFIEGARRTSPNGTEIVCDRGARDQLRWRRAD